MFQSRRFGISSGSLMSISSLLFVYGSLMRGGVRHRHLLGTGITPLGAASICARLFHMADADYPVAIPGSHPRERVHGELYTIDEPARTLAVLDRMEECKQGLFRRKLVWIRQGPAKEARQAWAYFYARTLNQATPVRDGRFRRRRLSSGD